MRINLGIEITEECKLKISGVFFHFWGIVVWGMKGVLGIFMRGKLNYYIFWGFLIFHWNSMMNDNGCEI
jgi:hypothetical protein